MWERKEEKIYVNKDLEERCNFGGDLNVHKLVMIYEAEKKQASPADDMHGNPAKWGTVRGIAAVRNYILEQLSEEK